MKDGEPDCFSQVYKPDPPRRTIQETRRDPRGRAAGGKAGML